MSDREIYAPDAAIMIAGCIAMGLLPPVTMAESSMPIDKLSPSGTLVSIDSNGQNLLPTGRTTPDAQGDNVPEVAAQPGVYAAMRFLPGPGQADFDPATMTGPGCTAVPLPRNTPMTFA